jgi:hypothetical protein
MVTPRTRGCSRNVRTESGRHAVVTAAFQSCVRGGNRALAKLMPNAMKENKDILCCAGGI